MPEMGRLIQGMFPESGRASHALRPATGCRRPPNRGRSDGPAGRTFPASRGPSCYVDALILGASVHVVSGVAAITEFAVYVPWPQ
jgi:hypothetical protein